MRSTQHPDGTWSFYHGRVLSSRAPRWTWSGLPESGRVFYQRSAGAAARLYVDLGESGSHDAILAYLVTHSR